MISREYFYTIGPMQGTAQDSKPQFEEVFGPATIKPLDRGPDLWRPCEMLEAHLISDSPVRQALNTLIARLLLAGGYTFVLDSKARVLQIWNGVPSAIGYDESSCRSIAIEGGAQLAFAVSDLDLDPLSPFTAGWLVHGEMWSSRVH